MVALSRAVAFLGEDEGHYGDENFKAALESLEQAELQLFIESAESFFDSVVYTGKPTKQEKKSLVNVLCHLLNRSSSNAAAGLKVMDVVETGIEGTRGSMYQATKRIKIKLKEIFGSPDKKLFDQKLDSLPFEEVYYFVGFVMQRLRLCSSIKKVSNQIKQASEQEELSLLQRSLYELSTELRSMHASYHNGPVKSESFDDSVLKDCNKIGNSDQAKEIYASSDSHVVFTVM